MSRIATTGCSSDSTLTLMSTRSGTSLYSAVLALNSLSTKHSTEQHRTAVHMPTMSAAVSTCSQLPLLASCAQMLQAALKPHPRICKRTKSFGRVGLSTSPQHPSRMQRSAKRHQHAAPMNTASCCCSCWGCGTCNACTCHLLPPLRLTCRRP